MTILIRPDRNALCWLATFGEDSTFPSGTYPLPYTLDAPVQLVASALRAQFPGHRVTGVQANCVGCGQ